METRHRIVFGAITMIASAAAFSQAPFRPNPEEVAAAYQRAEDIGRAQRAAYKLQLVPNWIAQTSRFWYRNALSEGRFEYWFVDPELAERRPAFDHAKLAESLAKASGKEVHAQRMDLANLEFDPDLANVQFDFDRRRWEADLSTYNLKHVGEASRPTGGPGAGLGGGRQGGQGGGQGGRANISPDRKWVAEIVDGKLRVTEREGGRIVFESKTDSLQYVFWAPDSMRIVAYRVLPGDRKEVYLIRSSPQNGGRATLQSRRYDLPGDKLDTFETFVVEVETGKETQSPLEPIITGGHPWVSAPDTRFWNDGKSFLVRFHERGYQRYRVEEIDLDTAQSRTLIDERSDTFVDTTSLIFRPLPDSKEILWRSERDGWGRLYLIDGATGSVKNAITPTGWVVRSLVWVDEGQRKLAFSANCTREGEDPYFIHFFLVDFDGNNLVRLTDGPGTHRVEFSPDRKYIVDTYSRVDFAPVHELRRTSDGGKVLELERADLAQWKTFNIPFPEPFVAKGRDGVTDIWGVVIRPTNFDPSRRYPIIENIYAGPQDSFVPKSFNPLPAMQRLAELGFIVVQIDGMGTRNRGKKFHDVCWKNIADAGFPDRKLWMQALAAKYPYVDLERVGVYGTSAGGQNAAGALLFHPEFYKVGVASCGCHDNRMDKYWWNEQWMGVVGPHYAEQSNITHASKLQGRLLLMVGELDTNVPPESTYRLVDALIRAGKEFEFVLLTGMDHTGGGAYGERKRRDFFVKHLLGVEPPDWNRVTSPAAPGPSWR